jgi:hypothetical protein
VISDSGNDGAYGMLDPESGKTVETGALALGDAGDDMEGVAAREDRVYTLTSAGWMRVYKRAGAGFELVDGPYAIGEGRMMCGPKKTNCARNYEGLCLGPANAPSGCTGFAASKEDGVLYCLKEVEGGRFAVVPDASIRVTKHDALADCAFDDAGQLYAASNFFDTNRVYQVDGWRDPASAVVTSIGSVGVGFGEGIAVRGDVVYRFSDLGGAPSLISKFGCPGLAR